MPEKKKIIRLADVGELEADLKEYLAEEEAKGKDADILYCESIGDEISDLESLPTIDPKSLRSVAHWAPVDPDSDVEWECSKCEFVMSTSWDGYDYFNYCPCCGAKMEGATNE